MTLKVTYNDGNEDIFKEVKIIYYSDGMIRFRCFKNTVVGIYQNNIYKIEEFLLEGDEGYVP